MRSPSGTRAVGSPRSPTKAERLDLRNIHAERLGETQPTGRRRRVGLLVRRHCLTSDQRGERLDDTARVGTGVRGALLIHHEPVLRRLGLERAFEVDSPPNAVLSSAA